MVLSSRSNICGLSSTCISIFASHYFIIVFVFEMSFGAPSRAPWMMYQFPYILVVWKAQRHMTQSVSSKVCDYSFVLPSPRVTSWHSFYGMFPFITHGSRMGSMHACRTQQPSQLQCAPSLVPNLQAKVGDNSDCPTCFQLLQSSARVRPLK